MIFYVTFISLEAYVAVAKVNITKVALHAQNVAAISMVEMAKIVTPMEDASVNKSILETNAKAAVMVTSKKVALHA